jgi:type II secretory pathway predicted ATPase ExeA/outer membrane protein OmpA-like peptidoglycan-associated protein
MYCNFFRFSVKPFELTPDPRFLYLNEGLREGLATLVYGIQERRGFILMTGEPGTGKTTLLNAAADHFDENTKVAFIFNTSLTFEGMLHMALVDLNLAKTEESLSKRKAIQRLNDFALKQNENNGNVVLIIDEAQNLNEHSLENLRLLSNLQTRQHKLIQIVLAGQPELDITLQKHKLRQLVQRIGLRLRTTPLNEKDAYEYIQHRLKIARYEGPPLFGNRAKKLIWAYSQGIPRTVNILCDNSLLGAYALERKRIDSAIVDEAIQDLSGQLFAEVTEDSRDAEPDDPILQMESGIAGGFFAATKNRLKKVAPIVLIALIGVLLSIAGIWSFRSDNSESDTVHQNDPASKPDNEKADTAQSPSLPQRNLSVVKADPEKPLSLPFPDDHLVIYFNHNSFEISDKSIGILNRLVTFLMNNQDAKILVTGYTDSTGPKSHNDAIAKKRAETVKKYLIYKGVNQSKINAVGLGAQDFIASNKTENGRKLNRRVEIELKIDNTHL